MDKKIEARDTPIEEFYARPDSAYIRIKFIADKGVAFSVKNEVFENIENAEDVTEELGIFAAIVRGMVEAGYRFPGDLYALGLQAQEHDFMDLETEDMPEEHAKLLQGEIKGVA